MNDYGEGLIEGLAVAKLLAREYGKNTPAMIRALTNISDRVQLTSAETTIERLMIHTPEIPRSLCQQKQK